MIEIWSPSTGDFGLTAKIPDYQRRGDLEIWFVHPRECTLRAWRRQPAGTYDETVYHGGIAQPGLLPQARIDLDELFAGKTQDDLARGEWSNRSPRSEPS